MERFWSYVFKTETCWNWVGDRDADGYGRFWYRGKTHRAHRLIYEMVIGPVNKDVLHSCDNPSCVNPDHLFLGQIKII